MPPRRKKRAVRGTDDSLTRAAPADPSISTPAAQQPTAIQAPSASVHATTPVPPAANATSPSPVSSAPAPAAPAAPSEAGSTSVNATAPAPPAAATATAPAAPAAPAERRMTNLAAAAAEAPKPDPPKRKRPKKEGGAARKGKWTVEEYEYTTRIIELFNGGLLELPEGVTLRAHLARKLSCDPMRITKKFSGASCLGNKVFHSAGARPRGDRPRPSPQQLEEAARELQVLEGRFQDACVRSSESKDVRMIDLEARFQNSDRVVSTPAIDAFIMQSCQPTWDPDHVASAPPPLAEPRPLAPAPSAPAASFPVPQITQLPAPAAAGPAPASPQTSNDQIAAGLLLGFGRACSQNSGDSSELVGFVEDVTSRAAGPPPPPPES